MTLMPEAQSAIRTIGSRYALKASDSNYGESTMDFQSPKFWTDNARHEKELREMHLAKLALQIKIQSRQLAQEQKELLPNMPKIKVKKPIKKKRV